jgi:hypothetical protein
MHPNKSATFSMNPRFSCLLRSSISLILFLCEILDCLGLYDSCFFPKNHFISYTCCSFYSSSSISLKLELRRIFISLYSICFDNKLKMFRVYRAWSSKFSCRNLSICSRLVALSDLWKFLIHQASGTPLTGYHRLR